jgi:hypothetical protein
MCNLGHEACFVSSVINNLSMHQGLNP